MTDRELSESGPTQNDSDPKNDLSPPMRTDQLLEKNPLPGVTNPIQTGGSETDAALDGKADQHDLVNPSRQDDEQGSGEPQVAIEQLIDDYSRFLFGYAYRMVGSVSDAEDLTQQTFLIAHQKLEQLRTAAAARSWLCAILRSCWLKSIRRNQPKPVSNLDIELSEMLFETQDSVHFDSQAIQLAVRELPPDYRLVLLMYYFEELSYQEIANKLNVKIGTVMSRLSRAKDRVRQRLKSKDSLLDK